MTTDGVYLPVDYKLSTRMSESFMVQITAYAMLVEAQFGVQVATGYIYLIGLRSMNPVPITMTRQTSIRQMLGAIREMVRHEQMPPPAKPRAKCTACEFRRFCNDV